MTLERRRRDGHGVVEVRLVTCPICGYEFDDYDPRWHHFLEEHDPEDAGLGPIDEVPDADGRVPP